MSRVLHEDLIRNVNGFNLDLCAKYTFATQFWGESRFGSVGEQCSSMYTHTYSMYTALVSGLWKPAWWLYKLQSVAHECWGGGLAACVWRQMRKLTSLKENIKRDADASAQNLPSGVDWIVTRSLYNQFTVLSAENWSSFQSTFS